MAIIFVVFTFFFVEVAVTNNEAEDGSTIQDHISSMKRELQKASPNMGDIDDRMSRTLGRRLELIQTATVDVLDNFPALGFEEQVVL